MARIIFEDSCDDRFWFDPHGHLCSNLGTFDEERILLVQEDVRKFAYWLLSQTEPEIDFDDDDEIDEPIITWASDCDEWNAETRKDLDRKIWESFDRYRKLNDELPIEIKVRIHEEDY